MVTEYLHPVESSVSTFIFHRIEISFTLYPMVAVIKKNDRAKLLRNRDTLKNYKEPDGEQEILTCR